MPAHTPAPILQTQFRILSFLFWEENLRFGPRHLIFGLICTWVVGMGRYWDHPDPHLLQTLGLGSVIYVFTLTAMLWLVLKPLRLEKVSYVHMLTLVTLTSLPALLYAIPVERFVSLPAARSINVWFLGIVALWRVAIYLRYIHVYLGGGWWITGFCGLLPLAGIVSSLGVLNLEQAVFEVMAGLEGGPEPTSNDDAYLILVLLTYLSYLAAPVLLIAWLVTIVVRHKDRIPGSETS